MDRTVIEEISGWGRFPTERCHLYRPASRRDLVDTYTQAAGGTRLPRGLGRSYGDAALNEDGGVVLHTELDRMLAFDAETGRLRVEAGVSLGEILEQVLPRGFFLPVVPGTQHVTVGGAIASDIHGKNHHRDGAFSTSVASFQLLTPTGEVLTCSRDQHAEIFWATLGGMGLTGAILEAELELLPVETAYVVTDHRKASDLAATLSLFDELDTQARYSVAWLDALAPGDALGRSVVMTGEHATLEELPEKRQDPLSLPDRSDRTVPFPMPTWLLNHATGRTFNALYYRTRRQARDRVEDVESYFFPLDTIADWNRLYGKRGFVQYQFVVPGGEGAQAVTEVLEHLQQARVPSFLAVLKRMGPGDPGPLAFPMEGLTLALDLPASPTVARLAGELDEIVLAHGGRVYLAKDALLGPEAFQEMYPEAATFRALKAKLDPDGVLTSSLARRVGLVDRQGGEGA